VANGILSGIQVLDFTRVVAGPYCTRILADLGAQVIKVDKVPEGEDPVRSDGSAGNNVGKRSIAIDLKQESGIEVALKLAANADVIVENFRPGVMDRLSLGYQQIAEINPDIIFASISGFGQTGPLTHRRAYGATAHAEAGWLWVQQQASGSQAPFAPGVTVADIMAGTNTVLAILAALFDRERTGQGQWIDITLMESQLAMLNEPASQALAGNSEERWRPFRHPIHSVADGHVTINIADSRNWHRITEALEHPGEPMPEDPEDANAIVGSWVAGYTIAQLASRMDEAGAPYGVVRTMPETVSDPYFIERGMIVNVPDPLDGSLKVVGSPFHFSKTGIGPAEAPPLAGEHSKEVLESLGYSGDEITSLVASRVIGHQSTPA